MAAGSQSSLAPGMHPSFFVHDVINIVSLYYDSVTVSRIYTGKIELKFLGNSETKLTYRDPKHANFG